MLSYIIRKDTRGQPFRAFLESRWGLISAMTRAELYQWAERRTWGAARRETLRKFISGYEMVYPNDEICALWAAVSEEARRHGRPIGSADAWHAATARFLGAPLLTHNVTEYEGVSGLVVITR